MEHTRKAKDEGWKVFGVTIAVGITLLLGVQLFSAGHFGMSRGEQIVFYGIIFTATIAALCYAAININSEDIFVCRLTDQLFFQHCPVKQCGESFKVRLGDIAKLECRQGESWYIHTNDGETHQITNNYGNPAKKFADALLKSRPEIKTVST